MGGYPSPGVVSGVPPGIHQSTTCWGGDVLIPEALDGEDRPATLARSACGGSTVAAGRSAGTPSTTPETGMLPGTFRGERERRTKTTGPRNHQLPWAPKPWRRRLAAVASGVGGISNQPLSAESLTKVTSTYC